MSYQNTLRLITALFLSCGTFLASWYWYQKTAPVEVSRTDDSIGYISRQTNEVQKRVTSKILWESTTTGEALFAGEAIRTSKDSEAKFVLLEANTELTLMPDSLIVLEKSERGLQLNFLSGDLFINTGKASTEAANLTVVSGENSFKPENSSVTLRKDQVGKINIEVQRGHVDLKSKKQTLKIDSKKSMAVTGTGDIVESAYIQILSPALGEQILVEKTRQVFNATFEKLAANTKLQLEYGPDPKSLKSLTDPKTNGNEGRILIPAKPGRIFWRISAIDSNGKKRQSQLQSQVVTLVQPPVLVNPKDKAVVSLNETADNITTVPFAWRTLTKINEGLIEVSKDKNFSDIFYRTNFSNDQYTIDVPFTEAGSYYWRVSGALIDKNANRRLTSSTGSLTLGKALQEPISPPIEPTPIAIQQIEWLNPAAQKLEVTKLPTTATLDWKPLESKETVNYKIKVSKNVDKGNLADASLQTQLTKIDIPFKTFAEYEIKIEAYDSKNNLLGTSASKNVLVLESALLAAPSFSADSLPTLIANPEGNVEISWNNVDGAVAYEYELISTESKKTIRKRVSRSIASLENLNPGDFTFQVRAIDSAKRSGLKSSTKKISVPQESSIQAPKIDKVEIK
jgi:hypothetical protein